MLIRRETEADVHIVDEVHARAFAGSTPLGQRPVEVALLQALRPSPSWIPSLSIVAETPDAGIVGHVVCTRGNVDQHPALGLGPIGVLPAWQGRGVGHALMHAVLAAADAMGEPVVALVGEPKFYGRFGFVPARSVGILPPDPSWKAYFQVRTLSAYHPGMTGTFAYAEPFTALS